MPVPFWAGRYIGLPFQEHGRDRRGLDCWGLVRLVLSEQFAIALPSLATEYARTTDAARIGTLIETQTALCWESVDPGNETCGDVVVMRLRGRPLHVGIVLGDRQMLHVERGINSAIERYNSPHWQDRLAGFYRYKAFFA